MYRYTRLIALIGSLLIIFSACNSIPDHARFIPNDAIVVVGVNAKALGKKVTWNVLTGSKLFKEMQQHMGDKSAKSSLDDLQHAGIDIMNTFYLYIKADKRLQNGNRMTGLVPLSDAGQWEGYLKKSFPQAAIQAVKDRKEAHLSDDLYIGWTKNLLIVMNTLPDVSSYYPANRGNTNTQAQPAPYDDKMQSADMDNAFNVQKENALTENKHFSQLEKADHDVVFWLNYDQMMQQYMSSGLSSMMGGFTLSNVLWKDAAFAGGFDFNKGRIDGDMKYYVSNEMTDIAKEMGSTDADKDMINNLPARNMDMVSAWHLSPKGLKSTLDKMGLLGIANVALSQQGMDADYILNAFSGDMAFCLNNFTVKAQQQPPVVMPADSDMMDNSYRSSYTPSLDAMFVVKIGKKENFDKLMQMAAGAGLVRLNATTYMVPVSTTDSVFIITNNNYAVVGNRQAMINNYLQGNNKGQKFSGDASSVIYGHPFSFYADIAEMVKTIDPSLTHSPHDSAIIAESKKLLNNGYMNGGEYKNGAIEYKMKLEFNNKDENSLLELMDFGMRVSDTTHAY